MNYNKKHLFMTAAIVTAFCLVTSGCSFPFDSSDNKSSYQNTTDAALDMGEMRNICELATLKCQYHNVAKATKNPGSGLPHLFEKERKFWIEYEGTVEVSFDGSQVEIQQNGNDIDVTLPEPQLECAIVPDSFNEDSYIVEPDHLFFQKNPITADDQTKAVQAAQSNMEQQVRDNSSLLQTAEAQAEYLIRNYITELNEITGTEYQVHFHTTQAAAAAAQKESSASSAIS